MFNWLSRQGKARQGKARQRQPRETVSASNPHHQNLHDSNSRKRRINPVTMCKPSLTRIGVGETLDVCAIIVACCASVFFVLDTVAQHSFD